MVSPRRPPQPQPQHHRRRRFGLFDCRSLIARGGRIKASTILRAFLLCVCALLVYVIHILFSSSDNSAFPNLLIGGSNRLFGFNDDNNHQQNQTNTDPKEKSSSLPNDIPLIREFAFPDDSSPPYAIFYNIYIPNNEMGQENAMRIVREQMNQIKAVFAPRHAHTNATLHLFYTTLGEPYVLTSMRMQGMCGGLTEKAQKETTGIHLGCQLLEHVDQGTEVITLGHMHTFCREHPTSRVVYLHNKGSFHYHEWNENWRPLLTHAAISDQLCLRDGSDSTDCNVCGLNFYTEWTPFFPGNMFMAQCSYVRKLIPPQQFERRMEQAIETVMQLRLQGQLLTSLLDDRKDRFGLDRYSSEHWIGSHPDLRPCDCDPTKYMWTYLLKRKKPDELAWAIAPRAKGSPDGVSPHMKTLHTNKDLRIREYFLLAGNLIKWFSLYNQAPPPDSWAWTWYPDGEFWRSMVEQHGANAVQVVTEPYKSPMLPRDPLFAPDMPEGEPLPKKPSKKFPCIFYNVYVPPDATSEQVRAEMHFIQQQIATLAAPIQTPWAFLSKKPRLYYLTMGHDALSRGDLCINSTSSIDCHRLPPNHVPQRQYRGEMLRHVFEFCRSNPTQKVIYIQNHDPAPNTSVSAAWDDRQRKRLLMHATMAVTNNGCLDVLAESDDQCNVCGLVFYNIPKPMMAGNIWAAHCSHVIKLLPPKDFVKKMRDFVTRALILKLWTKFMFNFVEARMDHLGYDAYALEHWIGSHPYLVPCSLSTKPVDYWMSAERSSEAFKLSVGGIHKMPIFTPNHTALATIDTDDGLRIREFYFLAGNILKWYMLYGEPPPKNSWVWTHFPDGHLWTNRVSEHGIHAVDVTTSKYADSGAVE